MLVISFSLFDEYYTSAAPIPIDREGSTTIEVRKTLNMPSSRSSGGLSPRNSKSVAVIKASGSERNTNGVSDDSPYVLASIRIKDDGGRDIVLRSILSLRNDTSRPFKGDFVLAYLWIYLCVYSRI